MARLVPESPKFRSKGEERVAERLRRLPDDCVVYHEPRYHCAWPDFVVLSPRLGVLVLEVKSWRTSDIRDADRFRVGVRYDGRPHEAAHPIAQARRYQEHLRDYCRNHPLLVTMLRRDGRLRFPIGHAVVLNKISRNSLDSNGLGEIFPAFETITSEIIEGWAPAAPAVLEQGLGDYFTSSWSFPPLTPDEFQRLRTAINPTREIRQSEFDFGRHPRPTAVLEEGGGLMKYLDERQESAALALGTGHRLLIGVAGSGKTLILLARARYLSRRNPEARVLFLCYNRALAAWVRFQLRAHPNIDVCHFHALAAGLGVRGGGRLEDDEMGEALLGRLRAEPLGFGAVMVDEGQDFPASWFRCAVAALGDAEGGDLVVATDGVQGLYRRRGFTWSAVGIRAPGRVETRRLGLYRNYRNTRSIIEAAAPFASGFVGGKAAAESHESLAVDPSSCLGPVGPPPMIAFKPTRRDEVREAYRIVRGLLDGRFDGSPVAPLRPEQIGILYPPLPNGTKAELQGELVRLVTALNGLSRAVWLSAERGGGEPDPRDAAAEPAIKVQTMHSAKGLQYRAVVILWADLLPFCHGDAAREREDRRLFYVALTRAESLLAIIHSNTSPFLDAVAQAHGSGGEEAGPVDVMGRRPCTV